MSEPPQVDSIFLAAAELASDEERAAYLAEACGDDDEIRSRVEQLLKAHAEAGSFMDEPNGVIAVEDDPFSSPDRQIGPYKLLEQIGEGGMGVVYMAEQERPIRRRVALKIIKPGMDTRQVIVRFEAERQALAMMDHPSIAKVFDAGATDSGRPYFVMELVQGVPVTEYCDQCQLTTRERLELFITVCQAVQHAHQKGVIHRDIKPTNVLVAMQDGRPAPKIIDFGVAKALNQRLTERTLATGFAQMIGTPLYMSPEQAELSPLGADTRSDIYSLGVLLYELLTGTTPFDKDRIYAASYDELRCILREEEPPRPSARLSTLDAKLATTVAEHHRTEPRRLVQTIRSELDWIVMKCLEKDRTRRYETANGLARDIGRYLADEPVEACPPSAPYRLKKLIRRNKIAVAFILLLTIGAAMLAASNVLIKTALREKVAALTLAQTNEQRATTESAKATAIAQFLQEMLASANPDQAKGAEYTVRQLLDEFSASMGDQLSGQPEVEAAIRAVIGNAYRRLNEVASADFHLRRALRLRRNVLQPDDERVADSLVDSAWNLMQQNRHAEAEAYVREALSIYEQHGSATDTRLRALWSLQTFLASQYKLDEAEGVAHEALALAGDLEQSECADLPNILHALAHLKIVQQRYDEAELRARQSVDLHRRLHGNYHPETAWGLLMLGRALRGQGRVTEAEGPIQESLNIFREHYSDDHTYARSVAEDLQSLQRARETDQTKSAEESLANKYLSLALTLRLAGHWDESLAVANQAVEASEQFVGKFPDSAEGQQLLGRSLRERGAVYRRTDRFEEADQDFQRATTLHSELAVRFPDVPEHQSDLARCFAEVGLLKRQIGQLQESAASYREAIRLDPNEPAWATRCGGRTGSLRQSPLTVWRCG